MSINITRSEAIDLTRRMDAAADDGHHMLDVILPNGKPLGECTGEYIRELGQVLIRFGLDS